MSTEYEHDCPDVRVRRRIERYARGEFDASERAAFMRHVEACSTCRDLLESDEVLRLAMLNAGDGLEPSGAVWGRIEARVEGVAPIEEAPTRDDVQPWKRWVEAEDVRRREVVGASSVARADDPDDVWQSSGHDGITTRRLAVDPAARRVTMMVRMQPGARFPSHRHGGAEECYVVAGDLRVGDELHLTAGDFQRCEPESIHPVQWTEGGCELLIISSVDDEIIETA